MGSRPQIYESQNLNPTLPVYHLKSLDKKKNTHTQAHNYTQKQKQKEVDTVTKRIFY